MAAPTLPPIAPAAPPAVRVGGAAPPAPAAVRMDVAAFVGRVASGTAAAVESADAFSAAFAEARESRLGPAVRAFFRNGGRRCWVIPAEPPFFDPRLALTGTAALVRDAALMDDNDPPRGVHAVLAIEEITLLAVPDAFAPSGADAASVADDPAPDPAAVPPKAGAAAFGPCKVRNPAALDLTLTLTEKVLEAEVATLPPRRKWQEAEWNWKQPSANADEAAERAVAKFVLEQSPSANFPPNQTETVYRGPGRKVAVGTNQPGYRVRAETAMQFGAWAMLPPPVIPIAHPVAMAEHPVATQVAAVKVCAARGDILAVLVPPESWPTSTNAEWAAFWKKDHPNDQVSVPAGDWVGLLQKSPSWPGEGGGELRTHAALWGPWVLARDGDRSAAPPAAFPADGAVCGLLARRAAERGAWASVLNIPLAGSLGLGPFPYGAGELVPLSASDAPSATRAVVTKQQSRGINMLARTPRGFVAVGERTAWPDPRTDAERDRLSEPVPVRQFMALLRRELARVGVGLAFAPNGPALERRAVRAVEAVLEDLLRRGALLGPDARSSFQVTARAGTESTQNRLEVEVRVRPALPLRVLTVYLVRTGEDAFSITEGHV